MFIRENSIGSVLTNFMKMRKLWDRIHGGGHREGRQITFSCITQRHSMFGFRWEWAKKLKQVN